MSWDIFAMKFPKEVQNISDLPEAFKAPPIADSQQVIKTIRELFPHSRLPDAGLLTIESGGYAIEMAIGTNQPCTGITFFVRGADASGAANVVKQICECLEIRAWDINGSQFLDTATDQTLGHKAWVQYKTKAIEQGASRSDSDNGVVVLLGLIVMTCCVMWWRLKRG